MLALGKFASLFDTLPPYQKKEIIRFIMKKAILNPEGIKIALIGRLPNAELFDEYKSDGKIRCQTSIWLPVLDEFRNWLCSGEADKLYKELITVT